MKESLAFFKVKTPLLILYLFFLSLLFISLQGRTYNPNTRVSDAWMESNRLLTRTLDRYIRHASSVCGKHNVRATATDTTELNTDQGHIPSPRIGMKTNPAGNRIRAAELEGRDSSDHATVTEIYLFKCLFLC